MARIDRLIQALAEQRADRLILASGERAALRRGDKRKLITSAALGNKLLAMYLDEIVPPELAGELAQEGTHSFAYESPFGRFAITLERSGTSLGLEVSPGEAAPSEAAPAEAVSPVLEAEVPPRPATRASAAAPEAVAPSADTTAMDALFREMVEGGCSDLHLCTGNPPLFRKDGSMQTPSSSEPLAPGRVQELLYSITPPQRRAEFEERNDTDFSYEIPELGRFRCNLFRDRRGAGGVFRVIPAQIPTAQDLGLSAAILKLCDLSKGLVVVTGPTGSGKSTTLAAMVDYINCNRPDHVITIEDPIEFVHENKKCLINQREVGNHTAGFKAALRAALREDPDIVLVGEMRDLETVEIAIETAETGHLVFGTLHTNTAPSTVDRIIDQFPTDRQAQVRTMLSSSLRGVIAQTLCRKKGGGRVAAQEVLIVNRAVSNLIREAKTFQIPSIMQTSKNLGMVTLNEALLALVQNGTVEAEEACARAAERAEFANLLQTRGIRINVDLESE